MLRISLLELLDRNQCHDRARLPKNFHQTFQSYQSKLRHNGNAIEHQNQSRAILTHLIVQRVLQIEEDRQRHFRHQIESQRRVMPEECIHEIRSSTKNKSARLHSSKSKKKCLESFSQRFSMYQSTNFRPNSTPRSARKKREIPKNVHTDQCVMSMIYLGRKIFANEGPSNQDEILLFQQHAGGENLPVFKGFLKPNDRFEFVSRRHPDYPFAITCYINGLIDSRISTCCEMKHQPGVPLGGPRGSFMIERIQRGKLCRQCQFQQFVQANSNPHPDGEEKEKETETSSDVLELIDEFGLARELQEKMEDELDEEVSWKRKCFLYWQLGNIWFQGFQRSERALEYYLDALEILLEHYPSGHRRLRDFYLVIAFILEENQISSSRKYLERLVQIDSNETNLREDYYHLSRLYRKERNYPVALNYAEQSLPYQPMGMSSETFFPDYSPENFFDHKLMAYLSKVARPTNDQLRRNFDEIQSLISTTIN